MIIVVLLHCPEQGWSQPHKQNSPSVCCPGIKVPASFLRKRRLKATFTLVHVIKEESGGRLSFYLMALSGFSCGKQA